MNWPVIIVGGIILGVPTGIFLGIRWYKNHSAGYSE